MPDLSPAARRTVERAATVLEATLDDLGPWLSAASGAVTVETKADGTPITDADLDVDRWLAEAIHRELPGHGVLSEEHETVVPDTSWCWVIDPIDGTSNFTAGLPYWCVSAALALDGEVVLGVVDAPVLGARYLATAGGGTTRDGRSVEVRPRIAWDDRAHRHVPVMLTTATARHARGAGLALNPRVMGSTALDLAVVAEGVAAASVARIPHVWDIAAGQLLVREAGGEVVTLSGDPLLPLTPGVDHARTSAATASGTDADHVAALARSLLPET